MDWEEDPFESIVREFFGESPRRRRRSEVFTENEEEDRVIDFVETKDKVYVIFELPGYTQKEVTVTIKGNRIEVAAQKRTTTNTQEYLLPRLRQGTLIRKLLPSNILEKKFDMTFKNGILEVSFTKKSDD